MKHLSLLIAFLLPVILNAQPEEGFSPSLVVEPEKNDTNRWNSTFLKNDLYNYQQQKRESSSTAGFPLEILAVPVVDYGFGASGVLEYVTTSPKMWSGVGLFIGKHSYNSDEFTGEDTHIAFFNLLVLTDTIDLDGYSLYDHEINSRNHPDYLGQGRVLTKNHQVDYVAIHKADNTSFAIVGGRLFDLQLGQTVIVIPQLDGSVRMHQLNTCYLPMQRASEHTQELVESELIGKLLGMGNPIPADFLSSPDLQTSNQFVYLSVESESSIEGIFDLIITPRDSLENSLSPIVYSSQTTPYALSLPVGRYSLTITNHDSDQRLLKKVQCDAKDARKGMVGTFEAIGRIEIEGRCNFKVL